MTVTDTNPFSGFAFTLLFWLAVTVSTLVLGVILIALWPTGGRRSRGRVGAIARPGSSAETGVLFFF